MRIKVKDRPGKGRRSKRIVAPILCVLVLAGPASALAAPAAKVSDPFEPVNRAFFGLHQMLDHYVIRPAAVAYTHVIPPVLRKGLANMASNLGEPAVFVNDVLQGRATPAMKTVTRFAGNSTFGLLGFFDIATPAGVPHHPNDFGMTLARYGVGPGPYIFIPLAGPTTVRDAVGAAANMALNPLVFVRYAHDDAIGGAQVVTNGLQTRADADQQLKALFASATDPYASFRSYYLQAREAEIFEGRIDIEALPDFGPTDTGPAAAAKAVTPASTVPTAVAPTGPAPIPTEVAEAAQTAPAQAAAAPPVAGAASRLAPTSADPTSSTVETTQPTPPTTTTPTAVVPAVALAPAPLVTPVALAHP